jgi:hypothetical protein
MALFPETFDEDALTLIHGYEIYGKCMEDV